MGWTSYREDIESRREESGLAPADHMWRRRPKSRPNELADVRRDFEARKAAHTKRYRERQRKTAFRRFVLRMLRRLRLIK